MSEHQYLGPEFLAWLWHLTETRGPSVEIDGCGTVFVTFGKQLVLETQQPTKERSTVVSDDPSLAEEARIALRTGKKVVKATLLLDVAGRQFEVTVNAETLHFHSVKLPSIQEDDSDVLLADRIAALDELEAMVDGLFLLFARLRLDPARWHEARVAIHAWISAFDTPGSASADAV